jgi:hypothetical protein
MSPTYFSSGLFAAKSRFMRSGAMANEASRSVVLDSAAATPSSPAGASGGAPSCLCRGRFGRIGARPGFEAFRNCLASAGELRRSARPVVRLRSYVGIPAGSARRRSRSRRLQAACSFAARGGSPSLAPRTSGEKKAFALVRMTLSSSRSRTRRGNVPGARSVVSHLGDVAAAFTDQPHSFASIFGRVGSAELLRH